MNDEIYIEEWPELVGRTFVEVTRSFDFAIPIGLKRASDGKVIINPPRPESTIIEKGDEVIVIAEDNDSYMPLPSGPVQIVEVTRNGDTVEADETKQSIFGESTEGVAGPPRLHVCHSLPHQANLANPQFYDGQRPQHFLFLGWRRDVMDMIRFLDEILSVGSSLTIMSTMPVSRRLVEMAENGRKLDLNTLALHHVVGNHVSRRQLATLPLLWYDAILILSEKSHEAKVLATDSLTCASLVLVRDIQAHKQCPSRPPSPGFPINSAEVNQVPISPRGVCATTTTLVYSHDSVNVENTATMPSLEHRGSGLASPSPPSRQISLSAENLYSFDSQLCAEGGDIIGKRDRRSLNKPPRRESVLLNRLLDSPVISSEDEEEDLNARDHDDSKSCSTARSSQQQIAVQTRTRRRSLSRQGSNSSITAARKKKRSEKAHREVKTQIICELLDSTRWDQLHRFCDVVASNDFTSRILAMVSERAETNQVLLQLLSQRGSEILVRPLRDYADHSERLNFHELASRALLCGDICIGYKRADDKNRQFVLNPRDKFAYITWSKDDRVAVIGYDHTVRC